ncbi:hypothetical protein BDZ89DRAFT_467939 [Hymenopellis radicata]|nr:hypothetical protein BDZ89DRAFT_467939 [Hymenopellis radicata]
MTFLDDHSRKSWVFFLRKKSDAFETFKCGWRWLSVRLVGSCWNSTRTMVESISRRLGMRIFQSVEFVTPAPLHIRLKRTLARNVLTARCLTVSALSSSSVVFFILLGEATIYVNDLRNASFTRSLPRGSVPIHCMATVPNCAIFIHLGVRLGCTTLTRITNWINVVYLGSIWGRMRRGRHIKFMCRGRRSYHFCSRQV